jgi:DNA polymerase III alpha subunit (gram-positive type)
MEKAEILKIPVVASNNVHYCEKRDKILRDILIANEGVNGLRHSLYREATMEGKFDNFNSLPDQHLLSIEELIEK